MSISWRYATSTWNSSTTFPPFYTYCTTLFGPQELRAILTEFQDEEYTNMRVTAFNILRYDPSGRGGLAFHIDMVRTYLPYLVVTKQQQVRELPRFASSTGLLSAPAVASTTDTACGAECRGGRARRPDNMALAQVST